MNKYKKYYSELNSKFYSELNTELYPKLNSELNLKLDKEVFYSEFYLESSELDLAFDCFLTN